MSERQPCIEFVGHQMYCQRCGQDGRVHKRFASATCDKCGQEIESIRGQAWKAVGDAPQGVGETMQFQEQLSRRITALRLVLYDIFSGVADPTGRAKDELDIDKKAEQSQVEEKGTVMNGVRALEIIARGGNWWLQSKFSQKDLDGTPTATCGCGACSLCAYRYFESLVALRDQDLVHVADDNYAAGRKHGAEESGCDKCSHVFPNGQQVHFEGCPSLSRVEQSIQGCLIHDVDARTNPPSTSPATQWKHHKNCAVWTVTLEGKKKLCDCAQPDSVFKGSSMEAATAQGDTYAEQARKIAILFLGHCPPDSGSIGWDAMADSVLAILQAGGATGGAALGAGLSSECEVGSSPIPACNPKATAIAEAPERIFIWNDERGFGHDIAFNRTAETDVEYVRAYRTPDTVWHWSREVGRAACGADDVRQGLTDVAPHLTCLRCCQAYICSGTQARVESRKRAETLTTPLPKDDQQSGETNEQG